MTTADNSNPYRAGSGLIPPYLAGRRNEIGLIERNLRFIEGKAGQQSLSPFPILALVGPRGVGKTVLLDHAVNEASKRGIHTAVLNSEKLSGSQEMLVKKIFPANTLEKVLERLKGLSVDVKVVGGFAIDLNKAESHIIDAMPAFLSEKPLLLVLDEAHTCEKKVLKMLFTLVQECMTARLPIAFIIAGTPVLPPFLRRCNVTYMERSKFLRFNTLSDDEAREALEKPARDYGRPLDADALELLLDWADNYPFFVQQAGRRAWNASMVRGGDGITIEDARNGLVEADIKRVTFYKERFSELDNMDLVECAAQSIGILRESKGEGITAYTLQERLMEMNEDMDDDGSLRTVDGLLEVGFLWEEGDQLTPGISSMFDYIERNVRAA